MNFDLKAGPQDVVLPGSIQTEDEELFRCGIQYVSQALKGFVAPGYIAVKRNKI